MLKKLLLVAFVTLFAVAAFAEAKTSVWGNYQLGGRVTQNPTIVKEDKNNGVEYQGGAQFLTHYLEIWGALEIDNFKATLMINPFDHIIGNFAPDALNVGTGVPSGSTAMGLGVRAGEVDLRRAFATWTLLPGLSLTGGLVTAGEYDYNGAFSGYYNGLFLEHDAGEGVVVAYSLNKDNAVLLVVEKYFDGTTYGLHGNLGHNETPASDSGAIIAGANLKFGDIVINPRVSYTSIAPEYASLWETTQRPDIYATLGLASPALIPVKERVNLISAYIGGGFVPANGFFVNGAVAFSSASGVVIEDTVDAGDIMGGFGIYLNPGMTTELGTVGLEVAYSSYASKEILNGAAYVSKFYNFGGSFDRTLIIDQANPYVGSKHGSVPAMTTVQLYADLKVLPALTVSPRFAYYISNVKDKEIAPWLYASGVGKEIGKDTKMMEVDLTATFALSAATSISLGGAYATFNDFGATGITGTPTEDADAVMSGFWGISTNF